MKSFMQKTLREKLLEHSVLVPETGCLLWQLGCNGAGYGKLVHKGRHLLAYRAAYIEFIGEIPPGKLVLHKCDTRHCVNYLHLFAGTHQDNSSDMKEKGRSARGHKHYNAILTEASVRDIRARLKAGEKNVQLAREYSVTRTVIAQIKRRDSWDWLEDAA